MKASKRLNVSQRFYDVIQIFTLLFYLFLSFLKNKIRLIKFSSLYSDLRAHIN